VGAHSVVLPGVRLAEGAAVGALSLVKGSLEPWSVYGGVPARSLGPRRRTAGQLAAGIGRPRDSD
jgi:acetyltransferase-like isoleucine patch superfamily enzyme